MSIRGFCPVCKAILRVLDDGTVPVHWRDDPAGECLGSEKPARWVGFEGRLGDSQEDE